MYLVRFIKPVLYVILCLAIAQCSGSSDDGSTVSDLVGNVDPGVCPHSPYVGGGPQTTGKSFNVSESGYFEKRIITDKLDSLLTSSGLSIANFILRQGVQLYQIDEKSTSECQYFAFLKEPTEEALKNWEDNSNPSGNGKLLGLFTTYYVPNGDQQFTLREPTIMVRKDTQKWTLLHEFSHFLFAESRVLSPMTDNGTLAEELKTKGDLLNGKIKQFNGDQTLPNAQELIKSIDEFFALSHELNQRGPLEEFTIESMLVDRFKKAQLTLVNERQDLFNAVNYMRANTARVVPLYKELLDFLQQYDQAYFQNNWPDVSTESQRIENKIAKALNFIRQKIQEAQDMNDQGQGLQPSPFSLNIQALLGEFVAEEPTHQHYDIRIVELQEELYEMFH